MARLAHRSSHSSVLLASLLAAGCVNVEVEDHLPAEVESGLLVLEGDALADELFDSPVREADAPFVRLGLIWDSDAPDGLEISTSPDLERWSDWAVPVVHHTELEHTGSYVGQIELDGTPQRFYRLRAAGTSLPTFLRLELLATEQAESLEDTGGDEPPPARLIGQAEVHARADWGARSASCSSALGAATRMAIHHTETPTNDSLSPAARLRQIQSYHMDVKGWCDIGYHYLMSRDGQLWEGRRDTLLGAHALGANTGNLGIAVMGTHDTTPLTETQLDRIAALVRGLADDRGITIDRTRIKGHREYGSTTCPGAALFAQLGTIVDRARGADDGGGDGGTGCSLASDGPWACSGLTGASTNASGGYYTTSFGCWVDDNGVAHSDGGDNCIPACSLASIGCDGLSGPACERSINWYAADADRFGCGARIHVTNPDNGKSAVLMVIDRGPNCSIEGLVDFWVLDMSSRASHYLFGGPTAATEHADVQVVVVPATTPLGPTGAAATCEGEPPPPTDGTVTVIGVLYAGADTAARIAGATETHGDGRTTTTSPTGLWQFADVPEGEFTVTGAKPGYQTLTITRTTYAAESWASFGLSPADMPSGAAILQGVVYHGGSSTNRIPHAAISLSTGHVATADGNGFYKILALPAGEVTITASAPGYAPGSVVRTLVSGQTEWGSVQLAP
jgi:hypothetical protein